MDNTVGWRNQEMFGKAKNGLGSRSCGPECDTWVDRIRRVLRAEVSLIVLCPLIYAIAYATGEGATQGKCDSCLSIVDLASGVSVSSTDDHAMQPKCGT
jgi:hypothetical protein